MKKLKFKSGEIGIITDVDEMIKAVLKEKKYNKDNSERVKNYLKKENPRKCIEIGNSDKKFYVFFTHKDLFGFDYSCYNGVETPWCLYENLINLFGEYYKSVNDSEPVEDIYNSFKIGDIVFYREKYSPVYHKYEIENISFNFLGCIMIKLYLKPIGGKKSTFITNVLYKNDFYKDGRYMCYENGYLYPSKCFNDISNKILDYKKKKLASLEKSVNKLKAEIEKLNNDGILTIL